MKLSFECSNCGCTYMEPIEQSGNDLFWCVCPECIKEFEVSLSWGEIELPKLGFTD